jgi:signal transduction histidine kinase
VLDLNGRVIMVEGQNAELFHELSEDQQEEWSVTRLLSPLAPLVFKARKEKEAEGIVHLFDRIWSTHLQLVASGGAEPEHLIAVLYDTTENHKSQQARDQFVSMVSHELRTPLTAIHGAIQLLSQEGILGAQQRKNLFHLMQRNTGRLRSIINDLLDLNKIKAGQLHFVLEPKQLQSLLQLTIETLDSLSEHHDTRIQLEAPSEPITVVVDEQRLQQVTTNFLSNAIKFSPKGSVIEVNVQVERNHVKVSVLDEGPGVPEDKRDMIFQPFVQVDNSSQRTKGGTGLGLALAQQFIVRMDGTIGYEAQEKGACFWFKLPLA